MIGIKSAIIIHRNLAVEDESASDLEQAEKILFFYPYDMQVSQKVLNKNLIRNRILTFFFRYFL